MQTSPSLQLLDEWAESRSFLQVSRENPVEQGGLSQSNHPALRGADALWTALGHALIRAAMHPEPEQLDL